MDVDGDGRDDEDSDFVANDAEQEVIREPRSSLSGYHAPSLKKILACLQPWS